ncbi:hypothetical protein J4450_07285 [Candidatus Micrarchaeota archaeon]|nr:hypothetical protein [Candidatus Micrarchaeota archaeon]
MDIYKTTLRISRYIGLLTLTLLLLNISITSANGANGIGDALKGLCKQVKTFLGAAMVLMILLAAITYAVGQVMGAETRARATVWATAMLTGAVIGAIIYIITPYVIKTIIGTGSGNVDVGATACD